MVFSLMSVLVELTPIIQKVMTIFTAPVLNFGSKFISFFILSVLLNKLAGDFLIYI